MNTSEGEVNPEASEKNKKQWQLNALILAGVFLLSVVLPPAYKILAPFLFVIPFIINVVNKIRQVEEKSGNSPQDQTHSPPMPDQIPSPEPYTYKPKDPKDPRRYKPIG
jgi:hypothetical protein